MSRGDRIDAVALFALLFLAYTYTFPRWADWNQNSRFDLTVAIVDHHTLSIDCCVDNTGDYAEFEGRTYSDKAPGLSFLAVPVYFAFRSVARRPAVEAALVRLAQSPALGDTLRVGGTGLRLEKIRFFLGLVAATALLVSLPSALAGVALYFFLARFTASRRVRLAVTLAYAFGTIAFPYAGAFYAHQLAAVLLFAAFCLVARGPRVDRPLEMAGLGFALGWALISEYPTALIAAPLAATALWRVGWQRALGWSIAAGLLPLVVAGAYNAAIFGTPLPVGYHYSALWQEQHSQGFLSLTYPRLATLWALTASPYRGLFFHCPVLLFSLPGLFFLWRAGRHRAEVALSAWAVVSFFAFNASSGMWWGGLAVGPRYLVPMLPFLAWPAVAALDRWRRERWLWPLFAVAFALSIAVVWGISWAGQHLPENAHAFPWRDHAWPRLLAGDLARNAGMVIGLRGWASLLPLAAAMAAIAAVLKWR